MQASYAGYFGGLLPRSSHVLRAESSFAVPRTLIASREEVLRGDLLSIYPGFSGTPSHGTL